MSRYKDMSDADKKTYSEVNRANMLERHGPLYYVGQGAKRRAKRDGRVYNLDLKKLPLPDYCPILGTKLAYPSSKVKLDSQGPRANSVSLDRIDNSKGYTNDNVRVVSYAANRLKADMSNEDIEALYYYTFPDRAPVDWDREHVSTYGKGRADTD